jgi:hypothetical protein
MVMNHRHQRRDAYLEYRVTVDPAKLTPVTPYWLSVVRCVSDPQYTVPRLYCSIHPVLMSQVVKVR